MAHRDELPDATGRGAPWRLLRGPLPTDECRWATAGWDAWDGVPRDAEADGLPAQIVADGGAGILACPARGDREQGEMRRRLTRAELCTPDAVPSEA